MEKNDNLSDVARGESTIDPDKVLMDRLIAYRHFVDHSNSRPKIMQRGPNGIYKPASQDPEPILYHGFEISYKMHEMPGKTYMIRTAFILYEDQPISEIPELEYQKIITAVMATLTDRLTGRIKIYSPGEQYKRPDGKKNILSRHMMIIEQHFIPDVLTERQPRQRLPNNTTVH